MKKQNVHITKIENFTNLPTHIAFILDGNRRWAKQRKKTINFGHKQGIKNIENICNFCKKYGIKYLTLYCLSTDNLNRSELELKFLFNCMKRYFTLQNLKKIHDNDINIKIVGDFSLIPNDVAQLIENINKQQIKSKKLNVQICISYSGKNEILNGIKNIVKQIKNNLVDLEKLEKINEKQFEKYIFTGDFPDVDLMIRTGGDIRISNFLLWKLSYAEFYFCKTYFPSFSEKHFLYALHVFQKRKRRYGK